MYRKNLANLFYIIRVAILEVTNDFFLTQGGHSMYKPSDMCIDGIIFRGCYFGNHVFLVPYYYVIL